MQDQLKKKLRNIPAMPGVYLLKDHNDRVIYVGKASSLRHRLGSYFSKNNMLSPRLRSLQEKLADIDFVVTDTEVEALILECNLIKEYRPRFNVNLKDDKDYPYLMITPEFYPRMELLRLSQREGRRGRYQPAPGKEEKYFGPFTDVGAVRETMRFISSIFPLRRCRQFLDGSPSTSRPCLNYQMNRCLAPCRGEKKVSSAEYGKMVRQVILFLQGRYSELENKLRNKMEEAAHKHNFEEAAILRDRLHSLQRVAGQRQNMILNENNAERDILALGRHKNRSAVHLFKIRGGKLLSQDHFLLAGAEHVENEEIIASFIKNYYNRADNFPSEVVASDHPADAELLKKWLKVKAGRRVNLRVPRRGYLKNLVDLARRNSQLRLEEEEQQRSKTIEQPLEDLGKLVGLGTAPKRIEGFDISHLYGDQPVGAMVVFYYGEPSKQDYRRFNIRKVSAGDDYAALQEVLKRRAGQESWPNPDLIIIDGGKGQLSSARAVLDKTSMRDINIVALAKNPDQVFLEGSSLPVPLAADNAMLKMLQRIRDEVHRFALSGHRRRRIHSSTHSRLEEIPGVGPKRRKALLNYFGSTGKVMNAKVDQLAEVPGISSSLAGIIYHSLHKEV